MQILDYNNDIAATYKPTY